MKVIYAFSDDRKQAVFHIHYKKYTTMKPFTAILSCILHCTFNLCVSY